MKVFCIIILTALLNACGVETNLITFTNLAGRVFTDVRISGQDATGFFVWTTNGAGAKILFTDAPEFLQKRFQFDAGTVAELEAQHARDQKEYNRRYALESARLAAQQKADVELKKRRDEFLRSYSTLSGVVFQRKDGAILVDLRRRTASGALVYRDEPLGLFALKNHPLYERLRTDDRVSGFARRDGTLNYKNLLGDDKSVFQFDCAIPAEWANDPEVRRVFSSNGQ